MFERIHPSVWHLRKPFSMFGQDIGSRMTVIKLRNGDLWLHSPVEMNEEEHRYLAEIGPVTSIVAPNLMHYLFIRSCAIRYPNARVYGVPGLVLKVPDVTLTTLSPDNFTHWNSEINGLRIEGMPEVEEQVFFHPEGRTLILTDLALHLRKTSGPIGTFLARVNQSYKTFGPSRICKLYIRDHEALRKSIAKVLEWDFDRVIVSHGEIIETGGKKKLEDAYAWLSGPVPVSDRILGKIWGGLH